MDKNTNKSSLFKINKGLDIPLEGKPSIEVRAGAKAKTVAILGSDHIDMKPTMLVNEGDTVKLGQPLFSDKKIEGVVFTSPAAGKVLAVNRGEKRVFLSVVIEVSDSQQEEITFPSHSKSSISTLGYDTVKKILLDSGEWTALRARPFGKTADPASRPQALFITAMDTNPLAGNVAKRLGQDFESFIAGCCALKQLTQGAAYICVGRKEEQVLKDRDLEGCKLAAFYGPHPAGLAGTHIHFLEPVSENKSVWHIGYADVIAIGNLFLSGKIDTRRIVALSGPQVKEPCMIETRRGASLSDITNSLLKEGDNRVVSGSAINGHTATGPVNFLGRYHNQITVLKEGTEREFMGWQKPGFDKFSVKRTYPGRLIPGKTFALTTSLEGSERAMVPVGSYESVMPLDILPTQLLRSLLSQNTEMSANLGALELIEEDIALCTFVCPGKKNYDEYLRNVLRLIEKGE